MSSKDTTSIEELVRKASKVGHTEVPTSTSELETKLIEVMKQTGKIYSAKELHSIFQEKDSKWFSDKLWNLAKKGVMVKLPTRGFYQYNKSQ